MSFDLLCYGCQKIFPEKDTDNLAFVCNCSHQDYPKYRCICRECVSSQKVILIPRNHNLSKMHRYQPGMEKGECICCPTIKEFLSIPTNIRYDSV